MAGVPHPCPIPMENQAAGQEESAGPGCRVVGLYHGQLHGCNRESRKVAAIWISPHQSFDVTFRPVAT